MGISDNKNIDRWDSTLSNIRQMNDASDANDANRERPLLRSHSNEKLDLFYPTRKRRKTTNRVMIESIHKVAVSATLNNGQCQEVIK